MAKPNQPNGATSSAKAERARPRAQQHPQAKRRRNTPTPVANRGLLRPGTGALREEARELVTAAARARQGAVAPYSHFLVGAALRTKAGKIIPGANVESASYGLTCCAERVALFRALTSGERDFVAIAVVAAAEGGPMPCGACRQLLAEYAPHARVWVADSRALQAIREFSVAELLPGAFTGAQLGLP